MPQVNRNNDPLHLDRVALMNNEKVYHFIGIKNSKLNVIVQKLSHTDDKMMIKSYLKGQPNTENVSVKKTLPSIKKVLLELDNKHGGLKLVNC